MNKKVKSIVLLSCITLSIALLSCISKVQAYSWETNTDIDFNNKLSQGKDIAYYVVSGNQYTVSIPQAVSKLRYPSGMWNPIVLTKTTVQSQSKMDLYQYSKTDGKNAYTQVWQKNSSGSAYNATSYMESQDWLYGKIYINDNYMDDYDNDLRSTVILHEMLHVYGCKDINSSSSVMYGATPHVRVLTSDANQVLVNKYNY